MNEIDILENPKLKITMDDFILQRLNHFPDEDELASQVIFSGRFEYKMHPLILKARKLEAKQQEISEKHHLQYNKHTFLPRKKRLLLVAVILAILLSVFGFTIAREKIANVVIEFYKEYASIYFPVLPNQSTYETMPFTNDDVKKILPTYLPAGYTLKEIVVTEIAASITYTNDENKPMLMTWCATENTQVIIDNEHILEYIWVRNLQGLYHSAHGSQSINWREGNYFFSISGFASKDELIKMAESFNKK